MYDPNLTRKITTITNKNNIWSIRKNIVLRIIRNDAWNVIFLSIFLILFNLTTNSNFTHEIKTMVQFQVILVHEYWTIPILQILRKNASLNEGLFLK